MIHRGISIHDVSPLGGDEIGQFNFDSDNVPRKGDVIGIKDAYPEVYYEVVRILWFTECTKEELAQNSIGDINLLSIEVVRFAD